MKKYLLAVLFIFCLGLPTAMADRVNLNNAETLSAPTSQMIDWMITRIDAKEKLMSIQYRWLDSGGRGIFLSAGGEWKNWLCQDQCFTDIFGFTIRSQDVGVKIGVGLRTLIWNRFKSDVLSAGNDGTFVQQ